MNDPTERSGKRRKAALKVASIGESENSTRANPTHGVEMAQKLKKDPESPAHGVSLLSEGTKAASGTERLNIEIIKLIGYDPGAEASTHVEDDLWMFEEQNESGGDLLKEDEWEDMLLLFEQDFDSFHGSVDNTAPKR